MEDPAEAKKRGGKSPVKRDVVRLVTRGTITEDDLLPTRGLATISRRSPCCGTARPISRWPGPMSRPARPPCSTSAPRRSATSWPASIRPNCCSPKPTRAALAEAPCAAARRPRCIVRATAESFDSEAAAPAHRRRLSRRRGRSHRLLARRPRGARGAARLCARQPEGRRRWRCGRPRPSALSATWRSMPRPAPRSNCSRPSAAAQKGSLRHEIDLCVTPPGSRLLARRLARAALRRRRDQRPARCGRGAARRRPC